MQKTRRNILEVLKHKKRATIDEIVEGLQEHQGDITSVTVRHHLLKLQEDGLVNSPEIVHDSTPGRPKYTYSLSEKAESTFLQNNYQQLTKYLIHQISNQLPAQEVNVFIEGVACCFMEDANIPQHLSTNEKLHLTVEYMNERGYDAKIEPCDGGYILHTLHCPYHAVASENNFLCQMDMRLVSSLLGVAPRLLSRISAGDESCSYFICITE